MPEWLTVLLSVIGGVGIGCFILFVIVAKNWFNK